MKISTIGVAIPPVTKFEMPTMLESYDFLESNIKPVEASTVELGYKIESLEEEVRFEKTNVLYAQQANQKLKNEICDWEVKYKNLEFANRNLQAQVDKIPTLKRTIRYMMVEHLDIELGDK